MPLIDVSEVLVDPDLASRFTVIRRAETVGSNGRSATTDTSFPNIVGVITMQSASELIRRDDGDMITRKISIVTPFRLRSAADGHKPDQVVLDGITYTITEILPYHRFGAGFVEALAVSMNATDPGPV